MTMLLCSVTCPLSFISSQYKVIILHIVSHFFSNYLSEHKKFKCTQTDRYTIEEKIRFVRLVNLHRKWSQERCNGNSLCISFTAQINILCPKAYHSYSTCCHLVMVWLKWKSLFRVPVWLVEAQQQSESIRISSFKAWYIWRVTDWCSSGLFSF